MLFSLMIFAFMFCFEWLAYAVFFNVDIVKCHRKVGYKSTVTKGTTV